MNFLRTISIATKPHLCRNISVSSVDNTAHSCKLLVLGGGSGGVTMAAKFSRRLKTKDSVIVLEPCEEHYYQPLFTLCGAGIVDVKQTVKQEKDVLPSKAKWIKDYATKIDPDNCCVVTKEGHTIEYEYIVIAVGVVMNYSAVPGMWEALNDPNSGVSTIYTPQFCTKTWTDMQKFKGGEAIFTFPKSTIKCPGAPQKIAYLADSYFEKTKIRQKANISYMTSTPAIFGVKKYADALNEVAKRKKIKVNLSTVLKKIDHEKREAFFEKVGDDKKPCVTSMKYDMLHVVPNQETPDVVRTNKKLCDQAGFLNVDMYTLQHKNYKNIYGIGDCTCTPNSKTAAAIAKQSYVVEQNLLSTMKKDNPQLQYDGYGACPLVTSYDKCILAEFTYGGVPHETMPFNQAKESYIGYSMKRHLFPLLYWQFMMRGYYNGPEFVRKMANPFGW